MTLCCAVHADRPAVYECDGCEKHLCEECIEEGHRLLFCSLCGERALPLTSGVAATTTELARERKIRAPYDLGDALLYPFRGLGLYVYAGYVLLLVVFDMVGWIAGLGCLIALFQLLVFLILPGFLFAIVRGTAEGETELPDWPDWSELGERFGEWFAFVLILVMAALPGWLLLRLGGCGLGRLFLEGWGPSCWTLLALGVVAGVTLWVPGVGAVGTWESGWLGWRADLHVKALIAVWDDAWRTIGLLAGMWLAALLLRLVFGFLPVMGTIAQVGIGVYALLTGAHLIGLLFRRNRKMLESVYLG